MEHIAKLYLLSKQIVFLFAYDVSQFYDHAVNATDQCTTINYILVVDYGCNNDY